MTTVYFATNRQATDSQDAVHGYPAVMVPAQDPTKIIYGTATVSGVDTKLNDAGTVSAVGEVSAGDFPPSVQAALSHAGGDLLVFIHGFDNGFADALTRAAFNREWLTESKLSGTETAIVAFCWPSEGRAIGFPVLQSDYKTDQAMARKSGAALMAFFGKIEPILSAARAKGRRTTLLVHSMGHVALESAVDSWFSNGGDAAVLFDHAILAAGDCHYTTFDRDESEGMSGLTRLVDRVSVLYSRDDYVLLVSMGVNWAKRLGQDGPHNMADTTEFPPARFTMHDCTAYRDYRFDPLSSHQYYRLSPAVRALIAADMNRLSKP